MFSRDFCNYVFEDSEEHLALLKEKLVQNGFSSKYAGLFADCIEEEKKKTGFNTRYAYWALGKGFLPSSAYAYRLDENNWRNYLSDYDYFKLWPINSWTRIWIDDKMTLKYILEGTRFSCLMPEYYFYSTENGLRELTDNPYRGNQNTGDLFQLIREKGDIACKPNNGAGSNGFFRLSFKGNDYFINSIQARETDLAAFVEGHPNYVFTEYLKPDEQMGSVSPLINTLRVVTINPNGNDPQIIGGYMRFGTGLHGETNHLNKNSDCRSRFDFVCDVNFEDGHIFNSKAVFFDRVCDMPRHPDSEQLIDFFIPNIKEIYETTLDLAAYLFNCEFLGFDFGITSKGLKLMEINSQPGIKYMQVFHSLFENEQTERWFKEKISAKSN